MSSPTTTTTTTTTTIASCPGSISEIPNVDFVTTIQGNNMNASLTNDGIPALPPCQLNVARPMTYTFISPRSTYYSISTNGSSFDTVLAVATTLRDCKDIIACSDDVVNSFTSALKVFLAEGMAYKIMVYGFADYNLGDFAITVSTKDSTLAPTTSSICPPDGIPSVRTLLVSSSNVADPPQIIAFPAKVSALPSPLFSSSCQANIQNPQFFDISNTLTSDVMVELSTRLSSYDTVMSVFSDSLCSVELSCSDDDWRDFSSYIMIKLTRGQRIRVAVSSFQDQLTGQLSLTLQTTGMDGIRRTPLAVPVSPSPQTGAMILRPSNHRICFSSGCSCETGWGGDSCSVRKTVTPAPTVFDIQRAQDLGSQGDPIVIAFIVIVVVPICLTIIAFIIHYSLKLHKSRIKLQYQRDAVFEIPIQHQTATSMRIASNNNNNNNGSSFTNNSPARIIGSGNDSGGIVGKTGTKPTMDESEAFEIT
jgi:hypothetical protein